VTESVIILQHFREKDIFNERDDKVFSAFNEEQWKHILRIPRKSSFPYDWLYWQKQKLNANVCCDPQISFLPHLMYKHEHIYKPIIIVLFCFLLLPVALDTLQEETCFIWHLLSKLWVFSHCFYRFLFISLNDKSLGSHNIQDHSSILTTSSEKSNEDVDHRERLATTKKMRLLGLQSN
jgi:hypothetical protein